MNSKINNALDHLFRHEYGKIVAGLTSGFGAQHIEIIEDAVQDSLLKASQVWAYNGLPNKPGYWLFKVSKNKLLDILKREGKSENFIDDQIIQEAEQEIVLSTELNDEQLKMIFACCHPAIQNRDALILSLKLISGFSIDEISRALLIKKETAKKSLQRAKLKFRKEVGQLVVPSGRELKNYLNRVLKVVYLMFNEAYKTSTGKELINRDLCGEALRLALLIIDKKECKTLSSCSLISLMAYKIARFDARLVDGKLIRLQNQNRQLWIREYIDWGNYYFHQATLFQEVDDFYLEASIEFQYHIAPSFEKINWNKVLNIHHLIRKHYPSPNAHLNYLIVMAKIEKAEVVLSALKKIQNEHNRNHLYFAFKAELELEIGKNKEAKESLDTAISLSSNEVEKTYLIDKKALIP